MNQTALAIFVSLFLGGCILASLVHSSASRPAITPAPAPGEPAPARDQPLFPSLGK